MARSVFLAKGEIKVKGMEVIPGMSSGVAWEDARGRGNLTADRWLLTSRALGHLTIILPLPVLT